MTLTIDLPEYQENDLRSLADANGVTLEEQAITLLRRAVQREQNMKAMALIEQWNAEDAQRAATMTPEEIANEEAHSDEILRNIANNRVQFRTLDLDLSDYEDITV